RFWGPAWSPFHPQGNLGSDWFFSLVFVCLVCFVVSVTTPKWNTNGSFIENHETHQTHENKRERERREPRRKRCARMKAIRFWGPAWSPFHPQGNLGSDCSSLLFSRVSCVSWFHSCRTSACPVAWKYRQTATQPAAARPSEFPFSGFRLSGLRDSN